MDMSNAFAVKFKSIGVEGKSAFGLIKARLATNFSPPVPTQLAMLALGVNVKFGYSCLFFLIISLLSSVKE